MICCGRAGQPMSRIPSGVRIITGGSNGRGKMLLLTPPLTCGKKRFYNESRGGTNDQCKIDGGWWCSFRNYALWIRSWWVFSEFFWTAEKLTNFRTHFRKFFWVIFASDYMCVCAAYQRQCHSCPIKAEQYLYLTALHETSAISYPILFWTLSGSIIAC